MTHLRLGHYTVRTADMEASCIFYTELLGLRRGYRPPFRFQGLWLYADEDETDFGVVHLIEDTKKMDADPCGQAGPFGAPSTGRLDHVAFLATGWADLKRRCDARGVLYVEATVPALGLHQVFLRDPSGITVEMNYPAAEAGI